ncbi:sigma-54-dependent Fis family transcriptional regulator [Oceanobacillus sp. CFH 90083]|uniref:sigma-54 interaction domain-containing protein n=1 Tax=Oceanobacillus sp. CFH 90083 TaxID=2592336 RepID=UPI0018834A48|nr:sigma 54-interacting transcriptional regulator [Oceanobacillus sp. CFH 90083]
MNEAFKAIIENIDEGVIIVNDELIFNYANKASNAFGLNYKKVIGKSIFDVFPYLKKENSTMVQVLETKQPIIDRRQTFYTYQGERKTTITSTYPIFSDEKVIGVFELFRDITTVEALNNELHNLQAERQIRIPAKKYHPGSAFIGESKAIRNIKSNLSVYTGSLSPIFIYGETGTGKEVLVKAIHKKMQGEQKIPLITQNCAAIPENLLESYLFGTTKGSYTDALDRKGLFELANGGILFLDEINSLPLNLQAKLLRVLQDQRIRKVGDTRDFDVQVKLIVASNRKPQELLAEGFIREDFYYRLNVLNIEIPPLRERKEDISLLVNQFIQHFNDLFSKQVTGISSLALKKLIDYDWPGNIRELQNVIERIMNTRQNGAIEAEDIEFDIFLNRAHLVHQNYSQQPITCKQAKKSLKSVVEEIETDYIKKELQQTNGNISQAARNLDIPQQTLSNKVKKYGLERFILEVKLLKKE